MITIPIKYNGLTPFFTEKSMAVSGQIGTLSVQFTFSEDWDMYPVRTVMFQSRAGIRPSILSDSGIKEIPATLIQNGISQLKISVFGTSTDSSGNTLRYNGKPIVLDLEMGGAVPQDSSRSPTAYEQLLIRVTALDEAVAETYDALASKLDINQGTDNAGRVLVVGEDGMVAPGEYAGGGGSGGIEKETDPTVPAWAKQPEKPTYTAEEVGAQPKGEYLTKEADPTVPAWAKQPEKPTYTAQEIGAQPAGDYALRNEIPSVPVQSVNGKTGAVQLNAGDVGARASTWMPSASDVGALPASTKIPAKTSDLQNDSGFVTAAVASLLNYYLKTETYAKGETYSQTELDALISGLDRRISAIADSDDTTLDQLSEIVAYIKANKSLIDSITTSKVSVADIVDNLTTSVANKPLSAAQGVALKKLIDALGTGKLDAAELPEAVNTALAQAKASGEFDGEPGKNGTSATHSWNGTTLTITSASGTSSADLKGEKGDPGKSAYAYAQDGGYAGTEKEFSEKLAEECISKNQGTDNVGKILVVGTDGNLVLIDMPEGGTNADVTGVFDGNNNILLSGNIAVGTYTLMFENADGTYTGSGTLEVRENVPEPAFTNLADPTSADWQEGYRLSISSGSTSALAGHTTTNYIPFTSGDTVRVKGLAISSEATDAGSPESPKLIIYNSNKTKNVGAYGTSANNSSQCYGLSVTVEGDVSTITPLTLNDGTQYDISKAAYIRFDGFLIDGYTKNDVIITVNEEIV